MTGENVAPEKVEQVVPPHAAGQEVLSYVQQQEKEADALFAEAHGIDPEKDEGDDKTGGEEEEKEVKGKEPEKADDKEAKGKEPEDKDKVAADEDLTKGLNTDNASKRISAAQNKMHDSNSRAKTAEEQTVKLQEENAALLLKLEAKDTAPAKVAEPGKEPETKETPKSSDDELQASLDELSQEYPEIAKPMLKMMARQEVENKRLTEKVDNLEAKEVKREDDVKEEKLNGHLKAISDVHEDFKEISEEPLLDEWIDGLPAMERAGARAIRKGGSTEDVIELLTTFKKANGYTLPADTSEETPGKKSNSKIEKAKKAANPSFNKNKDVNLKDGMVGKFTAKGIGRMTQKEYNAQEEEIDEWMQAGSPE